ncbi:hypothetical protein [Streptomyces sp. NBC_01615]|uniref:hypothetical protein n=1 Tax=Streptomyces sp. NBC_01615 TaxID=2975898 RepID=UPI003870EB9C
MGMQERWQSRQDGLVMAGEGLEAGPDWDARVRAAQTVIVEAARGAFERGDGWFEAEVDQRSVGSLDPYSGTGLDLGVPSVARTKAEPAGVPRAPRSDLLSRIEDEGWALHTAQYVYVQLGEESRNKWLRSGQRVAIKGKIIGVYLFRRCSGGPEDAQGVGRS